MMDYDSSEEEKIKCKTAGHSPSPAAQDFLRNTWTEKNRRRETQISYTHSRLKIGTILSPLNGFTALCSPDASVLDLRPGGSLDAVP